MPSNVLISGLYAQNQGLDAARFNGIYYYTGQLNGKPSYVFSTNNKIVLFYSGGIWILIDDEAGSGMGSSDEVDYPWLVTNWSGDSDPPDGINVTEAPGSYTLGLSGVKYDGYFDGDPQWFTTATRTSATELRSNFNPVEPTPENGYSWEWTGYFKPLPGPAGEIEDDFTFTMGSDDIGIMWVGAPALSGYTTANRTVSAYGYEQSAPISLRADTYYPVRIQFGHPIPPTAVSLQIQANPTLRMANDFVAGNLFNVIGGGGGINEFQRVANLHGGVANFLRKRLLGYF